MDIMTRKADGQQLFMEQKYTVTGDIGLMIQLFNRKGDK
jgi:predicted lipid carrier protein YhbT